MTANLSLFDLEPETPEAVESQWGNRHAVRASAGSGKTYQLTGHYLRVFLNGAEPSSILATTFTRKAAGEILGRVLTRLSEACDSDEKLDILTAELGLEKMDRARARKHLVQLCRALHQVSISTIDGFFARLLNGYRYDLGLPANLRMTDGDSPEIDAIRAEATRSLFEGCERDRLVGLLDSLQQGAYNRGVASAVSSQLKTAHELFETTEAEVWMTAREGASALPPEALRLALEQIERLAAEAVPQFAKAMLADVGRAEAGQWVDFLGKGLAVKVKNGEAEFSRKPISEAAFLAYQPLVRHASAVLLNRVAEHTRAIYELLGLYHEAYVALRRRERLFQFRDVPQVLAGLLPQQQSHEVAHRLDTNIDCLLLDEFQDTDPRQYAVLKAFAAAIHEGERHKGLLFCVGDLKQSIYGWRGAAPEIFRRFGDDFSDVQWTENNVSYRSSQIVLDTVNRLFCALETNGILSDKNPGAAKQWQPRFGEHSSKRDLPGYVEVIESSAEVEDSPEEASADEMPEFGDAVPGAIPPANPHFEFTARRIQQIANQAPRASIGVLLRSNAAASQLIFILNRLGVAASAEGGSPIIDDPAVGLILSALRFADHPSDSAARFHVVNSPLGPAVDLTGPKAVPGPEAAQRIRQQLAYHGYAATIAAWAKLIAPTCNERGAHRLTQLVELADSYNGGPASRPCEFVAYIGSQAVEEPSPAKIRVMTVHKAKGLEFDIVVLPELHKRLGQRSGFGLVYRRDPATLRITAVSVYPNKDVRELDPELDAICREHTQAEIEEALCLLYVAMTRPRHALHIIVPPLGVKKDGSPKATVFSLASIVRAGLLEKAASQDEVAVPSPGVATKVLYQHGDNQWFNKMQQAPPVTSEAAPAAPLRHLELDGLPAKTWKKVTPSAASGEEKKTAREILGLDDVKPRMRGAVLHAFLSRCSWLDESLPEERALTAIARAVWPAATEDERHECLQSYRALLINPLVTQLITRPSVSAAQNVMLWREQPFALLLEGSFISGVFDRVAIIREGERAIRAELIDYKTGARSAEYQTQMQIYRQALCAMLGLRPEDVVAKLLYTDHGALFDVP